MSLTIYDTLSRTKREFKPINPERVTLYVCGPTVYDYAHIGNARPAVVFDVLFRLLREIYGENHVVYARNITDVDDKINARAHKDGVDISVITNRYADIYNADMKALNVLPPTLQPRVTANMNAIIKQISAIIDNGHAYAAEGHVLFDVESYKAYGNLSNRSLDDMIAGARVEVAPYKRNAQDFVLWKPSKENEPSWESPWGAGRPGWHIECSAMIEENLGLPIDIHGGGHDLIFPHHENEIAQGVCAQHGHDHSSEAYAKYWMHNGFLTFGEEKMSKSLGNVKLVHELIKEYPGEVIRWALLSAHYRAPLSWTPELLAQSKKELDYFYGFLLRTKGVKPRENSHYEYGALLDDLNTPGAKAKLYDLAKNIEHLVSDYPRTADAAEVAPVVAEIMKYQFALLAKLLGILQHDPETWFKSGADDDLTAKVEALLVARAEARSAKNWPEADRIRDELNALNIEVMDGPNGATWKVKASV